MKVNKEKAKESWKAAGMNEKGIQAIGAWIDSLAANIEAGQGRWDAYARMASYSGSDPMGSAKMLKSAVEVTSAK